MTGIDPGEVKRSMAMVDFNPSRTASVKPTPGATAADIKVSDLSNDSVIVRLHFTINHLSRWITPVHDRTALEHGLRRGEPSVKELLIEIRDFELETFPKMYLIANATNPGLDKLPLFTRSLVQRETDARVSALSIMAEFRRLRQGTCSLLRSLPDAAWNRSGTSRREHDWQIRELAELLVHHDTEVLYKIDLTLDRVGARNGVSEAGRAHLDELLRLVPVSTRVVL